MARVVVVGSINGDLVARAPHLPAPGETVAGTGFARHPGGKGANQAVASARVGASTAMVGRVGSDPFGAELVAFLSRCGVDVAAVGRDPDRPTGVALIVVDDAGENTIVVVAGANGAVGPEVAELVAVRPGDVVLAQYETPLETTRATFARARAAGARTVLNPAPAAPVDRELLALCDVLVVNEIELEQVSGHPLGSAPGHDEVAAAAGDVRRGGDVAVVTTLGADGVVVVDGPEPWTVPAHPVRAVVDTTGAGDCFVGSLAARLVEGADLPAAVRFAVVAAGLAVQRPGAGSSMPTRAEVDAALPPS